MNPTTRLSGLLKATNTLMRECAAIAKSVEHDLMMSPDADRSHVARTGAGLIESATRRFLATVRDLET